MALEALDPSKDVWATRRPRTRAKRPAATSGMSCVKGSARSPPIWRAASTIPCACICARLGACRCSRRRKRSRWPSAWSAVGSNGRKPLARAEPAHHLRRRRRPAQAHRGQPAPGRQRRQEVHRPRHEPAGPDPGGQHRPDPRGREVRLPQRASSSRPTRPGGFARRSPAPSPTRRAPFASPSTWSRRSIA